MLNRSTYNELIKITSKPRSYIGFAALTILIAVILIAMKADGKVSSLLLLHHLNKP